MPFTEKEILKIESILRRLEPKNIESMQVFRKNEQFRTQCVFFIPNKRNQMVCIFQNFNKLSPYKLKLLEKLNVSVPYEMHITFPAEDIIRVGWKSE